MENNEETHWRKMLDPRFMGDYSLPFNQDVVLTIKSWEMAKAFDIIKQAEKEVLTISFAEDYDWVKPMIIKQKNGKMIERVTGEKAIEKWIGKKIQIGTERVSAFGTVTDALRVRNVKSDKLAEMHSKIMPDLKECKTRNEISIVLEKYKIFKPFSNDMRIEMRKIWEQMK